MNTQKYLPLGSVVLLRGATKMVMVIGFVSKGRETGDEVFDYVGCLYPEGVLSSNKNLLFDHSQIDKIYFLGYSNLEDKQFKAKLNDFVAKGGNSQFVINNNL